jgi:hypothetical protein
MISEVNINKRWFKTIGYKSLMEEIMNKYLILLSLGLTLSVTTYASPHDCEILLRIDNYMHDAVDVRGQVIDLIETKGYRIITTGSSDFENERAKYENSLYYQNVPLPTSAYVKFDGDLILNSGEPLKLTTKKISINPFGVFSVKQLVELQTKAELKLLAMVDKNLPECKME